jgi:hypothetical protein
MMRYLQAFAFIALLLCTTLSYVPFQPLMPVANLDASWALGMNELAARHAVFGRDVVFTFGPLASVYSTFYHPSMDAAMLAASAWLALSVAGSWYLILRKSPPWAMFCVALASSFCFISRDALLFAVPVLAALATALSELDDEATSDQSSGVWPLMTASILCCSWASIGLLPLIKGTMLALAVGLTFLSAIFLLMRARYRMAVFLLVGPAVVTMVAWSAVGQPLDALPDFLIAMAEIVKGYTEAMAYGLGEAKNMAQVIGFSVLSLLLLGWSWSYGRAHGGAAFFFFPTVFAFSLFMTFKAAFVRHDPIHSVIAMGMLVILGCVALARSRLFERILRPGWLVLIACAVLLSSASPFVLASASRYLAAWSKHHEHALAAVELRATRPTQLTEDFNAAMAHIRALYPLKPMPGRMDVYSINQAAVLAHGLQWRPRPVLQSYSAYTPSLAAINKMHLQGDQAPDWLWFNIEPIDERLPAIEDGASWGLLLRDFRPAYASAGGVVLKRFRSDPNPLQPQPIGEVQSHVFNQWIDLPDHEGPLLLSAELRQNTLGRLASTAFKSPSLVIEMRTDQGVIRKFRIVSGMLVEPVLISPLVEKIDDFVALYDKSRRDGMRRVRAFRVIAPKGSGRLWSASYKVQFMSLP